MGQFTTFAQTVIATVPIEGHPKNVAVNAQTNRVYVLDSSSTVMVLDGGTNTVVATVSLEGHLVALADVAVNAQTNRVYLPHFRTGAWDIEGPSEPRLSVLDGNTNTVIATVRVGDLLLQLPSKVAVNTQTNRVYIVLKNPPPLRPVLTGRPNLTVPRVEVFDGDTNTIIHAASVESASSDVAVNIQTNRVYLTNFRNNTVTVLDGDTMTVVASVPVGARPDAVAVNAQTNRVYVTNPDANTITVLDGGTDTVVASVPVGARPDAVAVNAQTNRVYVTNPDANTVTVLDGGTDTVVASVPVGARPQAVAVNAQTNRVYVINEASDTLTVLGVLST